MATETRIESMTGLVTITAADFRKYLAAQDACYEILSALEHDPAWEPYRERDMATAALLAWDRLARDEEAVHGD